MTLWPGLPPWASQGLGDREEGPAGRGEAAGQRPQGEGEMGVETLDEDTRMVTRAQGPGWRDEQGGSRRGARGPGWG